MQNYMAEIKLLKFGVSHTYNIQTT